MNFLVAAGVAYIIEALQDRKNFQSLAAKFAKVFVAIERAAAESPALAAAIEKARSRA